MKRSTAHRPWPVVTILAAALLAGAGTGATQTRPQPPEEAAVEFVRLFFDEKYDDLMPRMDATMQGAFGPRQAAPTRQNLLASRGAVQTIGAAWKETEIGGYVRYRVPVEFETGMHDLLVVFDGDRKVAGFFHVPHVPPPSADATPGREKRVPPSRPQEPKRPFPYTEEEARVRSGEITLAGTLTLPAGDGPFPAALLLTGSGAQNRDEEIFDHKPFLVWSDHLTRAGIAVLRMDDRGVGGSDGNLSEATEQILADDALACVRFLAGRSEIDPKSIGLIGHSEGGIVAPVAAARSESVAFVVMLAGTGVPGAELMVRQLELVLRAEGITGDALERSLAEQRLLHRRIASSSSSERIREAYARLVTAQRGGDPDTAKVDASTLAGVEGVLTPWYASFVRYDPSSALSRLRIPVLALIGSLDLQVDPDQNLPAIRAALEQAGNRDFEVKELPGLNHLFQKAQTGTLSEYGTIEETVHEEVLDLVTTWILTRFGARP